MTIADREHDRPAFATVDVCGLAITDCRVHEVVDILERALADDNHPPMALATVNLDFLRMAAGDTELFATLRAFDHCFADGWPILALAGRTGQSLPERVTGSDLTPLICRWASARGWRIGLVGASPDVQARLAASVPAQYGDILAGQWSPLYSGRELADPELADRIRTSGAQILLVALGCPKQEFWIRDNLVQSGARVAIGVGASLDFLAGTVPRAPEAWQAVRMEWMYRLLLEPRRLAGRYARDAWFFQRAWRQAGKRVAGAPGQLPVRMLATMIQGGRGGVYRYVLELASRLERRDDVVLEVETRPEESSLLPVKRQRHTPIWDRGPVLDLMRAQATARPPDGGILHVPSYRRAPWFAGERIVVTVHDLAPLHLPEKFGRARHLFLKHFAPRALERCARIIAVTEHTRRDLMEQFGLPGETITVVENGIDHGRFCPGERDAARARAQAALPQLGREFVLFLARIEHPGKGHVPLLEAWARLARSGRDMPQLVFAGSPVERAQEVFARARELAIEPLCTGYITDDVIVDLYRSCLLFVFPSLYEGFGLPPVEAMACGAPVASSRRAALAETAGPAATLRPEEPEQMADVIARLLDSDEDRAELRARGLIWARRFDWDDTVSRTLEVYRAVLAGR